MAHDAASTESARRAALRAAGVAMADVRRVLCFGHADNVLVDRTSGISLAPIRDSLRLAFEALERDGVLAQGQALTGVKFVVVDAKYHAGNWSFCQKHHSQSQLSFFLSFLFLHVYFVDANHRGPAQIVPAATRAFSSALLGADVRLVEPICQVEVSVKSDALNDVYSVLHQRRAQCEPAIEGDQGFVTIQALLGVRDSLGLPGLLRRATKV